MIKRTLCIRDYKSFSLTGGTIDSITGLISSGITWGSIYGITSGGTIEYYTGQTNSYAHIATIPILLTNTIDDIGFYNPIIDNWASKTLYNSGNTVMYGDNSYLCVSGHTSLVSFNPSYWELTPTNHTTGYTITFTGDTKINQFRRYGKNDLDSDLYNPNWNTGFTQIITDSNGTVRAITKEREKINGLNRQNLYDYNISVSGNTGATISYSDINDTQSEISYQSYGLTNENAIEAQRVKLDYLIGVINKPKINIDVFIDRGSNSSFDRHIKLGDIKSLDDLENYGNGYFKIKEN